MSNLYGQIDLTKLGEIVRNNPELVKTVTFRDGSTHKMLNVNIDERKSPDNYGNDHYIKVGVKKDEAKPGVNYFIADLKTSKPAQAPQPQPAQQAAQQVAMPSSAPTDVPQPQPVQEELPF